MIFCPIAALGFGGEAFFPVALTSILGGAICLTTKKASENRFVSHLAAGLLHDLVRADQERRDLVLSNLSADERAWFLAEITRVQAQGLSYRG